MWQRVSTRQWSIIVGAGGIGAFINLSLFPLCESWAFSSIFFSLHTSSLCMEWCSHLCITGNKLICMSYNHRITKWFGLEGTFKDHLVSSFSAVTSLPQQHTLCLRGFSHPLHLLTQENSTVKNAEVGLVIAIVMAIVTSLCNSYNVPDPRRVF